MAKQKQNEEKLDVVTPLKNKPTSKKGIIIVSSIIIGLLCLLYALPSLNLGGEKPVTPVKRYLAANRPDSLHARPSYYKPEPPAPEVETAKPEISHDVPPKPVEQPPAPPVQTVVVKKRRRKVAGTNPYSTQWMTAQRQSFVAGVNAPWGNVGPQKSDKDSADKSEVAKLREELLEYAGRMGADGKNPNVLVKSQKELWFQNEGNSMKGVLAQTRQGKPAPYVLPAGTIIPCVLLTGINTDLPGNIQAQVSENIFDYTDPTAILIPQGTRVWGVYDSKAEFGQKRVQVKWTRLTYPDGSTLNLDGMPGIDKSGYSGLKDKFNGHYNSMITAALLVSAFGLLEDVFEDRRNNNNNINIYGGNASASTVEAAVAESIATMGNKIFSKFVDRPPTIVIRPGKTFNIQVNADIPFTQVWEQG